MTLVNFSWKNNNYRLRVRTDVIRFAENNYQMFRTKKSSNVQDKKNEQMLSTLWSEKSKLTGNILVTSFCWSDIFVLRFCFNCKNLLNVWQPFDELVASKHIPVRYYESELQAQLIPTYHPKPQPYLINYVWSFNMHSMLDKYLKFSANFLFFKVFCSKNAKNDYFHQHFACAAPKRWLKFTALSSHF